MTALAGVNRRSGSTPLGSWPNESARMPASTRKRLVLYVSCRDLSNSEIMTNALVVHILESKGRKHLGNNSSGVFSYPGWRTKDTRMFSLEATNAQELTLKLELDIILGCNHFHSTVSRGANRNARVGLLSAATQDDRAFVYLRAPHRLLMAIKRIFPSLRYVPCFVYAYLWTAV